MNKGYILTIGYGARSVPDFLGLLRRYRCEFLVDVRTSPYSRVQPDFSRDSLVRHLAHQKIRYVFMGDTLGGRPSDETCYTNGRVDYSKCRTKEFFQRGIKRLHTAHEKNLRIILMCSERKPQDCHRSKLIGSTLTDQDIKILHINEDGNLKSQSEIIALLLEPQKDMFSQSTHLTTSRKRYLPIQEDTNEPQ